MTRSRTSRPRTTLAATILAARPTCDCPLHENPQLECGLGATLRVQVVCTEEDCDCPAEEYLSCRECVPAFAQYARWTGMRLHLAPL